MKYRKPLILGIILLILAFWVGNTLKKANVFNEYQHYFKGEISEIRSPAGIEDIEVDTTNGYAYLSSHNRRHFEDRGDIFLLKLNDSLQVISSLTSNWDKKDFRPHGISLFYENDSTKYLFVISHGEKHSVERFRLAGDALIHEKTFLSELFISPNDIHAVAKDKFYITNDHTVEKGFLRTIIDFVKYPSGNVVYFDGKKTRTVTDGIAYANGINTWADGKTLFVASTNTNKVIVFNRKENGDLDEIERLDTGVGVDNIDVDFDNNLWIGCHPQPLKFLAHAKDSTKLSPSSILKLVYIPEADYRFIQEGIYSDSGKQLSGLSVAVYYEPHAQKGKVQANNTLLAGSVFENKILRMRRAY